MRRALPADLDARLGGIVRQLEPELIRIRRHFHMHPEPSWQERQTTDFLLDRLSGLGVSVRSGREDLGVIGDWSNRPELANGSRIAIRADIDALRIQDAKEVEYASCVPGVMHACGHDAHTTIALGTAMAILAMKDALPFPLSLRWLFQPAEELAAGAQALVDIGAMESVTTIYALHVDPERPVGTVGLRIGALTAHCDELHVVVQGAGGHAARPYQTRDPIAAAVQLISVLYQHVPRTIDAREASVLTFGKIEGGTLPNVIPSQVELRGTLRTFSAAKRDTMRQTVHRVARGIAAASGTEIECQFATPLEGVVNDPACVARLSEAAGSVLGESNVQVIEKPSLGGEDFSVYLKHAPGAMMRLGCARAGDETPMLHSPRFDIDERALGYGVQILATTVLSDAMRRATE